MFWSGSVGCWHRLVSPCPNQLSHFVVLRNIDRFGAPDALPLCRLGPSGLRMSIENKGFELEHCHHVAVSIRSGRNKALSFRSV